MYVGRLHLQKNYFNSGRPPHIFYVHSLDTFVRGSLRLKLCVPSPMWETRPRVDLGIPKTAQTTPSLAKEATFGRLFTLKLHCSCVLHSRLCSSSVETGLSHCNYVDTFVDDRISGLGINAVTYLSCLFLLHKTKHEIGISRGKCSIPSRRLTLSLSPLSPLTLHIPPPKKKLRSEVATCKVALP